MGFVFLLQMWNRFCFFLFFIFVYFFSLLLYFLIIRVLFSYNLSSLVILYIYFSKISTFTFFGEKIKQLQFQIFCTIIEEWSCRWIHLELFNPCFCFLQFTWTYQSSLIFESKHVRYSLILPRVTGLQQLKTISGEIS